MKLGFIGTGNMASAIMGGIIKNNVIPAEESSGQIFLHLEEKEYRKLTVLM